MNNPEVFGVEIGVYSTLLAYAIIALFIVTIIHFVGYLFSKKIRDKTHSVDYFLYIKTIGVLALISTLGALTYQYGYMLVVCELCWWQRIFMFPIELIVISAIIKKMVGIHVTTGILSVFGIFFAGYHYYLHFKAYVLQSEVSSSCSIGGLLPSCTDISGVAIFGFITIPLMALIVFISILWLSIIAGRVSKHKLIVNK